MAVSVASSASVAVVALAAFVMVAVVIATRAATPLASQAESHGSSKVGAKVAGAKLSAPEQVGCTSSPDSDHGRPKALSKQSRPL
jgi:hypothetical protein